MRTVLSTLVLLTILPGPLWGQSLARRLRSAGDGTVRLDFAAREGVCSQGPGSITIMGGDEDDQDWESDCQRGPVRVALRMQGGRPLRAEIQEKKGPGSIGVLAGAGGPAPLSEERRLLVSGNTANWN